jgi:hypothetical protein
VGGFPTLVWNGTLQWSGAGTNDATGLPYRSTILSLLSEPSAFKLTVNSVDLTGPMGSIDLDVEVMEGGVDVSNMVLRMAITQDDVVFGAGVYYDVARDMIDDVPITVSELGQVQNVNRLFPVDPSWVGGDLEIIAFVQNDTDKKVHAAASSKPVPDYSMRYYALGQLQQVGPSSGLYYFGDFEVFNVGNLTDTFTVDLTGEYPSGWSAGLCDETVCWGPVWSDELAPGESKKLKVNVIPASPGYASLTVGMSQAMVTYDFPRVLEYSYITDDVDVLIVDDDGGNPYEDYFIDALDFSGYTFGVWDRMATGPSASALSNFPAVVWGTALANPTLDADDREALGDYLDAGGRLFITGQDIGWELHDIGGTAYQWYRNYLHADFIADDTNDYTLDGVPGDPISEGIDLVIQDGDGASNQEYPDDIDPADDSATVIWKYDANRNGAIRADTGTYKVVYLSFGFEAIDNAIDRRAVMGAAMEWLFQVPLPAGWVPNDTPLLLARGAGTNLEFSWGASCLPTDIDYEIHVGTLGDFYSHRVQLGFCSTGGLTHATVPPSGPGSKYYLVVPASATFEGSYGLASDGVERPQGTSFCLPQGIGECFP